MDPVLDEILGNVDEEDDGNVQLTSAELLLMVEEIWLNEKFSPEILPSKQEVVDCVLGQISYMEKNLETLPTTDIKKGIHQLEVDRIRFLLTSYLRHRLAKIEAYVLHILKEEEKRSERDEESYLTEAEQQFATKYRQGAYITSISVVSLMQEIVALEQHFDNVTSFLPGLPFEEWKNQPVTPNIHSFVFLKAKSEVQGVVVDRGVDDDNEVVDIKAGSQMLISYNGVADLVKKGDLRLI